MILLSIATLLFIALVAIYFLRTPSKMVVLCSCVSLLLLINFFNQIQAGREPGVSGVDFPRDSGKASINVLKAVESDRWKEKAEDKAWSQLIEDEKAYGTILMRSLEGRQEGLFLFEGLHEDRLQLLLELIFLKARQQGKEHELRLFQMDLQKEKCDEFCLQSSFKGKGKVDILVVKNIEAFEDIGNMEDLYFNRDITIIFQSPKRSFRFNSVFRFVQHYIFPDNYLSKFIGRHSSQMIEECLATKSFDYAFYSASKDTPMEELCQRQAHQSKADQCIRRLVGESNDPVPLNWVRLCMEEGGEGIEDRNGWVYPRKLELRGKNGVNDL